MPIDAVAGDGVTAWWRGYELSLVEFDRNGSD
jgi:hypothetical protein